MFGNKNETNKPWGTIEENGVGKFRDFTVEALREIQDLGVTHIWYTGVLHHALVTDYSSYGISPDDPDVVKGRAGSPYAVKDYYNVNPDLAVNPSRRLEEFKELIGRTHAQGMKVIIDIVPNHVARSYAGLTNPDGVKDFGQGDDSSVEYDRDNNFYYLPGQRFKVPEFPAGLEPLGGQAHPLLDGFFDEYPAKWTGNGNRSPKPDINDWYETVKVNYGVRPDGSLDFPVLPDGFENEDHEAHFSFWEVKKVPDSWVKFRDITMYWLKMGVDGFRYDMAEMVPVEFWSFLNSCIKHENPSALLLAEVYNPGLYRDYIRRGKMDYLYDKVQLYDTLKDIIKGYGSTDDLPPIQEYLGDIEHHMLHFLENHDEHRIASPDFAGNARKSMPAMVVSATISSSPTMIYFGQEVGEPGAENAGFGNPGRTSIFDYIGVPHHQRWMNGGMFDGGRLTAGEKDLRDFYKPLLNLTLEHNALIGEYREIHTHNRRATQGYSDRIFSFVRWSGEENLIIVVNFSETQMASFRLGIPTDVIRNWKSDPGVYGLVDLIYGEANMELVVSDGQAQVEVNLEPLESLVLQVKN